MLCLRQVWHAVTAQPLPVPKTGERNGKVLIEKLRVRAWNPGRRFDTADVPVAWITEPYDSEPNECFGPNSGLASLTEGNRPLGHRYDWPSAVSVYERNRPRGVPTSRLHLA
ncbi:hypothetical protein SHL15_8132 [Streptomyces hygroscopicus subsp. limoneus]|nr:hypothetical protein SHL15_8132 [Streptomyces hygroscopicus subsp. limoneus]